MPTSSTAASDLRDRGLAYAANARAARDVWATATAAVWLADAGIFVNDVPAISGSALVAHIAAGDTIAQIAKQRHVAHRTVMIELRRHRLVDAHRHRPTQNNNDTRRT